MSVRPVRTAVVGAGMISDIYLKNMTRRFEILSVEAICSEHMESARRMAEKYGIAARALGEILDDPAIELVVILAPAHAHAALIRRALEAGKHVYTEKTIALDHAEALALKALADARGLYFASAPDTFLGAALQTARAAIDGGLLGDINTFALASNRDNRLLNSFFRITCQPGGGVGYDYSVYYLTALVSLLGGVDEAAAAVRTPYPTHIDLNPARETFGQRIDTPNESEICAMLKLRSGACGTVHFNSDSAMAEQAFFAIYGTDGILFLPDPNGFGGQVRLLRAGKSFEDRGAAEPLPFRFGYADNARGVGPAETAWAIRQGRRCRADAQLGCHVLEVVDAMMESGRRNAFVKVNAPVVRPEPLRPEQDREEDSLR